mmetsp:Transcript_9876/g.31199  ORF Transcript_9876/g.31199 Transcript_9876/m.31199 type:complete len:207 (-) Transcript_9876:445-1065(-)
MPTPLKVVGDGQLVRAPLRLHLERVCRLRRAEQREHLHERDGLLLVEAKHLPVEAQERVEEQHLAELHVGLLDRIRLLAHRASRAQQQRLVICQPEELPVLCCGLRQRRAAASPLRRRLWVLRDHLRPHLGAGLPDAVRERRREQPEEGARLCGVRAQHAQQLVVLEQQRGHRAARGYAGDGRGLAEQQRHLADQVPGAAAGDLLV